MDIIIHIPWWVYLVAIYIVKSGLQASKTRIVSLRKLVIAPLIFTIVSVYTLLACVNCASVVIWGMFLLLGIKVGQWLVGRVEIKVNKEYSLIQLSGTWSTLIAMSFIFLTQFYFRYEYAVHPEHAEEIEFKLSVLALSAIGTGVLIGKLAGYLYCYKNDNGEIDKRSKNE